jgi:succinate dehydrogenase/fumarate reductase-like Fe-S protein
MQITLNIHRKDPDSNGEKPTFQAYQVEVEADATVLDALLQVRDEQDRPSPSGAPARVATVASVPCISWQGASPVQSVQDIMKKEVKVEPIRNILLKDLVYDMETFLFRKIKPPARGAVGGGAGWHAQLTM